LVSTGHFPGPPTTHPWINAQAFIPQAEHELGGLLRQSKSFDEYLELLVLNGYDLMSEINFENRDFQIGGRMENDKGPVGALWDQPGQFSLTDWQPKKDQLVFQEACVTVYQEDQAASILKELKSSISYSDFQKRLSSLNIKVNAFKPEQKKNESIDQKPKYLGKSAAQWIEALMNGNTGPEAFDTLSKSTKEAVPVLIELANNDIWQVRNLSVVSFNRLGPDAQEAIPALIKLLSDPYLTIRFWAASAIGNFGAKAKMAIPQLKMNLLVAFDTHPNLQGPKRYFRDVQTSSAEALAKIKEALPDDYGISPSNPIKVGGGMSFGPAKEKKYFINLRGPKGQRIQFKRKGSGHEFKTPNAPYKGIANLDIYEINYKGLNSPIILYVNMYDYETTRAPRGFYLNSNYICRENLLYLDLAKDQYTIDNNIASSTVITMENVDPYLPKGSIIKCPDGGKITLEMIDKYPKCTIQDHTL